MQIVFVVFDLIFLNAFSGAFLEFIIGVCAKTFFVQMHLLKNYNLLFSALITIIITISLFKYKLLSEREKQWNNV